MSQVTEKLPFIPNIVEALQNQSRDEQGRQGKSYDSMKKKVIEGESSGSAGRRY